MGTNFSIDPYNVSLRDQVARRGDYLEQYSIPIFVSNAEGVPRVVGTAFIVEHLSRLYLISAAHVLDHIVEKHAPYFLVDTKTQYNLSSAEGRYTSVPPHNQSRDDDRIDVAIISLDPIVRERLKNRKIVSSARIARTSVADERNIYLVSGFPATKTKLNPSSGILSPNAMTYWSDGIEGELYYRLQLAPDSHIGIKYDRKRSISLDGTRRFTPSPHGMSGSPIWLLYDGVSEINTEHEQVVGVLIEHDSLHKCLVGANIRHVMELVFDGTFN